MTGWFDLLFILGFFIIMYAFGSVYEDYRVGRKRRLSAFRDWKEYQVSLDNKRVE